MTVTIIFKHIIVIVCVDHIPCTQLSDQSGRKHKLIKAAVAGKDSIPYEDSNARYNRHWCFDNSNNITFVAALAVGRVQAPPNRKKLVLIWRTIVMRARRKLNCLLVGHLFQNCHLKEAFHRQFQQHHNIKLAVCDKVNVLVSTT